MGCSFLFSLVFLSGLFDLGLFRKEVQVLHSKGTESSYAYLANGFRKGYYTSLTLCTWAKFLRNEEGTLIYQPFRGQRYGLLISVIPSVSITSSIGQNVIIYEDKAKETQINQWFHICVSWCNESGSDMYLNGVHVAFNENGIKSSGAYVNASAFVMFASQNYHQKFYHPFSGCLYQTNIWKRLLSQVELCQLVECESAVADGDALGWSKVKKATLSEGVSFRKDVDPCIERIFESQHGESYCSQYINIPLITCSSYAQLKNAPSCPYGTSPQWNGEWVCDYNYQYDQPSGPYDYQYQYKSNHRKTFPF